MTIDEIAAKYGHEMQNDASSPVASLHSEWNKVSSAVKAEIQKNKNVSKPTARAAVLAYRRITNAVEEAKRLLEMATNTNFGSGVGIFNLERYAGMN